MKLLAGYLGRRLSQFLSTPHEARGYINTSHPELLASTLRPGDILLVDGNSRISTAIKYLTQSTWSHAALFIGDALGPPPTGEESHVLVEANLIEGVRAVPLSLYATSHTRICRPVGLSTEDLKKVIDYVVAHIGQQYDLQNLVDLARYLFPVIPVPTHWRRRIIALGSGHPTRAICSTLIAGAFQAVRYPILPRITLAGDTSAAMNHHCREIFHIHDSRLFAPRDFDVSPYFHVVKPTVEHGFDYRAFQWDDDSRR